MKDKKAERYDSINGLRLIACFGIVAMHMKANIPYSLPGYLPNLIINEFTNFVFLFMIISSFGMCCGYYNRIKNNEISPEKFYSKRIYKTLPFFLCLLILNTIIEHNIPSIIEAFANSTLMFGLLQKEISVLGVAWFIGLVFVFYFIFPFFTYLFKDKKSAWITTIIALLMNYACIYYFNVGRSNMFYSFVYFCVGGLLYLYKDELKKIFSDKRIFGILLLLISITLYFIIPMKNEYLFTPRMIISSSVLLVYAISYDKSLLNNKVTKFIGGISLEVYLSHMVTYRLLEKIKILNLLGSNWISYITITILVLIITISGAFIFQKIWSYIERNVINHESIISK